MKISSKIIIVIITFLFLAIGGVGLMFFTTTCPPQGPWPSPPWCKTYTPTSHNIDIETKTLSQTKSVQMSDTWGRNYNFMLEGVTWNNIEKSFDRIKAMGAEEVYIHDMHQAKYNGQQDFKSTDYEIVGGTFWDDLRDEEISQKHLNKLAEEAHRRNLKAAYMNNLSFVNIGKYTRSNNIALDVAQDTGDFNQSHDEVWIEDFFDKWEARMLNKADQLNQAGFDIMSITPTWMGPTFRQNEALANKRWRELIKNIKEKFNGQIHVIIPFNGFAYEEPNNPEIENNKYYDYYTEADIIQINFYGLHEKYHSPGTSVAQMRQAYNNFLDEIEARAKEKNTKFSIKFSAFSIENAVNFDEFVEYHDIRNPQVLAIAPDYQHQADQYQAFFEALDGREMIDRIIVGGFWWDDAMDPEVKVRISLSPSPRNKPAESLITQWFNTK